MKGIVQRERANCYDERDVTIELEIELLVNTMRLFGTAAQTNWYMRQIARHVTCIAITNFFYLRYL